MSTGVEPEARQELEARLLQLTDEILELRIASVRSRDFGRKIDEAAELMTRIGSMEGTGTRTG